MRGHGGLWDQGPCKVGSWDLAEAGKKGVTFGSGVPRVRRLTSHRDTLCLLLIFFYGKMNPYTAALKVTVDFISSLYFIFILWMAGKHNLPFVSFVPISLQGQLRPAWTCVGLRKCTNRQQAPGQDRREITRPGRCGEVLSSLVLGSALPTPFFSHTCSLDTLIFSAGMKPA